MGLMPASLCFCCLALLSYYEIKDLLIVTCIMALNGFFQAPGYIIYHIYYHYSWPGLVSIMKNWFGKGNRGFLMGIWACNANVGQIIGLQMGHMLIKIHQVGWEYCVIISSTFLFSMMILILVFLPSCPEEKGLSLQQFQPEEEQKLQKEHEVQENQEKINLLQAWKLPGVAIYALTYACLKSTVYGLLFWLPKYINDLNLENYSASIAQTMQIGTVCGGILTGKLSDIAGKRCVVMSPFLLFATFVMFSVRGFSVDNIFMFYVAFFCIGCFLGGPYTILSSAISMDLSEQPQLKNNKNALITISSLIEGTGAFTAAILQKMIPIIGQENLFYAFTSIGFTASMLLFPNAIRETKQIFKNKTTQWCEAKQDNKDCMNMIKNIVIKIDKQDEMKMA